MDLNYLEQPSHNHHTVLRAVWAEGPLLLVGLGRVGSEPGAEHHLALGSRLCTTWKWLCSVENHDLKRVEFYHLPLQVKLRLLRLKNLSN